nr:MAG TPA: CST complex subunit CTC1, CST complex, Ctc1, DNA.86A [Caudoviricetes sp.]
MVSIMLTHKQSYRWFPTAHPAHNYRCFLFW